jgi:hypothetical protein
MAYFAAERTSKGGPGFGNGDPRGVLAPEAANDAKDAGSALPSLAFGIPGSAEWAIILGAMVIHGVQPGPLLVTDRPDIVWLAIISIILASFMTSGFGLLVASRLSAISRIRPALLAPAIAALAVSGSYALRGNVADVNIAIVFGLLGYGMRRIGMPPVPLILGLLLGTRTERSFQQTLLTFDGAAAFVTRPISLVLVLGTAYFLFSALRPRKAGKGAAQAGAVLSSAQASLTETRIALIASGLFGAFVWQQSRLLGEQSREAPFLISSVLIVIAVLALVLPWIRARRAAEGSEVVDRTAEGDSPAPTGGTATEGSSVAVAAPATAAPATAPERADILATLGVFVVAMVLTWAFGVTIALTIVAMLLFRFYARLGGVRTVLATAVAVGILVVAFNVLLDIPLVGGSLLEFRYFL